MTQRIEQISQAEHDLIKEVHPRVHEIKEHVETVKEAVSPENVRLKLRKFAASLSSRQPTPPWRFFVIRSARLTRARRSKMFLDGLNSGFMKP